MKKFLIEWETCYCEEWPERTGTMTIMATNEEAARKKFSVFHAVIINIEEVKE